MTQDGAAAGRSEVSRVWPQSWELTRVIPFLVILLNLPTAVISAGIRVDAPLVVLTLILLTPILVFVDGAPAVCLIAAIPSAHAFSLSGANLGGLKVIAIVALLCWSVGAWAGAQRLNIRLCALDLAVVWLFAVALLNIAFLANGEAGDLNLFLEYMGSFVLYAFIRGTIFSEKALKLALYALLASSAVAAALGLLRYADGLSAHSEFLRRVSAPGGDINDFAAALLVATGLAFAWALSQQRWKARLWSWMVLAVLSGAIILSYSREVFVGGAVMIVIATLLGHGVRIRLAGLGAVIVAAVVAISPLAHYLALSTYVSRLQGVVTGTYQATSGRNILWSIAWRQFQAHPWFGLGIGNFATPQVWYPLAYPLVYRYHSPALFLYRTQQAHSFYLGWASDGGILALVFLIPAILLGALYGLTSTWIQPLPASLAVPAQGLFLGFVGFFVSQAASPTQGTQTPYLILALMGCMWIVAKGAAPVSHLPEKYSRFGETVLSRLPRFQGVRAAAVGAVALGALFAILVLATHLRHVSSLSDEAYLPFVPCTSSRSSPCLPTTTPTMVRTALIFDDKISSADLVAVERRDNVGYVWGAELPSTAGANVQQDVSFVWGEGWCPHGSPASKKCSGGPPSLPWLQAKHPTWLLWRVNRQGKPTAVARTKSNPVPAVDFTNPHVQKYWLVHYIVPALRRGFGTVAWSGRLPDDLLLVSNPSGAAGHFQANHRFVRQYRGNLHGMTWVRAQIRAMGQMLQKARSVKPDLQFALDDPVECDDARLAAWNLSLRHAQTIFDWEGYSYWGLPALNFVPNTRGTFCKNRWLFKTEFYIHMEQEGKHLVLINLEPYVVRPYMTDTARHARADLQWALANYLLVKYSHTYFWFGNESQYGQPVALQREESVNLGRPLGNMRMYHHSVYIRVFSKGMVLVNPSFEPLTITIPSGRYANLYGQRVGRFTMSAHSGLILRAVSPGKRMPDR